MIYGYARVSRDAQDYTRQIDQLQAAGCARIFSEKRSAAAGRKRPALHQLVDGLAAGDVMIVTALDRFARSSRDALNTLHAVALRGALFKSLAEPWADTTTPIGEVLTAMFLAFAQWERAQILKRTNDGRQAAKARGVKMGRKNVLNPVQRAWVRDQVASRAVSIAEVAGLLGVGKSTIDRAVAEGRDPPPPATPSWHAPSCAVFTSGAGNPIRCTCGGVAHGAPGRQVDIEELTR